MLCFGHRGAKGYAPENTLRGIQKGMEFGIYGVEIDIHAVHGKLLVIHDSSIEGAPGVKGALSTFTLKELRSIDCGGGEKIPFLSEVFNLVDGKIHLNIEIKGEGAGGLLIEEIDRVLGAGYPADKILVSSFHHRELYAFHEQRPMIPCGLLLYGTSLHMVEDAERCGCTSVHLNIDYITKPLVEEIHGANLRLFVYTVNEREDLERMRRLGVDGVFSDFPDRV